MFEKSQNAQATDLFPPLCVDFPCHTQNMPAPNRLDRQKNFSSLRILPFIKQGLVFVITQTSRQSKALAACQDTAFRV
ncbi:hypothetical protein AALA80_10975 [Oscillospiraceae bacterium 50-60]